MSKSRKVLRNTCTDLYLFVVEGGEVNVGTVVYHSAGGLCGQ